MNVQEFAALKIGDQIINPANNFSLGKVVKTDDSGVYVAWGDSPPRLYTVMTTIWFQWEKVIGDAPTEAEPDAAT